ncbi:MAG: hypothetical protein KUG71_12980 [Porticoccaceae bacterium]|nr:hypothetical protein [Porticoccaceae bacterium]
MIVLSFTFATADVLSETTVFKSTDSAGRISYGDKPSKEAIDFELIEIAPASESSDAELDKRLERMVATTKRLQEDRQARELQREKERESNTPEQASVVYYPAADPTYYRYPSSHRRKHRPDHHPHSGQNPLYLDDHYPYAPYDRRSSHYRREPYSVGVNLGFRSSRSSASLQFGSRRIGHKAQGYMPESSKRSQVQPYSPQLKRR